MDRLQTELERRATFVYVPASYFLLIPSYSYIFLSFLLLYFHVSFSYIAIPLSSHLSIHPFACLPASPSILPSNYLFTHISIIISSIYLSIFISFFFLTHHFHFCYYYFLHCFALASLFISKSLFVCFFPPFLLLL